MAHSGQTSNGVSLEDCHTNFFALADLNGIKWRRLTSSSSIASLSPLEDPVLSSFAKCLSHGLLCVWRRVPKTDHAAFLLDAPPPGPPGQLVKEMWLFWCGEEPETSTLLSTQMQELEQGSWESGLSYETRNLLFKALHNLVQRCLLAQGFVRLGRWFLQPSDWPQSSGRQRGASNQAPRSSPVQITFAFNFFVHGDSTVCVGVDVRQHPAIYRVTRQHLAAAQQQTGGNIKVILCPHGMQGTLTGASFREADSQQTMNEWRQFFPLPVDDSNENCPPQSEDNQLPATVQVQVANVRMKYPSAYVFVTETDEATSQGGQTPGAALACSKPKSVSPPRSILSAALAPKESQGPPVRSSPLKPSDENVAMSGVAGHGCLLRKSRAPSKQIRRKAWVNVTSTRAGVASGGGYDDMWQLKEHSCTQPNCSCFRCAAPGTKTAEKRKESGAMRVPSLKPGAAGNFHKRRSLQDLPHTLDSLFSTKLGLSNGAGCGATEDKTPAPSSNQPAPIPSVDSLSLPPSLPPSVDQPDRLGLLSPHSNLAITATPGSATVPKQEPDSVPPVDSQGGQLPPGHSPVSTPDNSRTHNLSPLTEDGPPHGLQCSQVKQEVLSPAPPSVGPTDAQTPGQTKAQESKEVEVNAGSNPQTAKKQTGLKRPTLPSVNHEEDVAATSVPPDSVLYDYSGVAAALIWDAQPPRKRIFPLRKLDLRDNINNDSLFFSNNCSQSSQNEDAFGNDQTHLGVDQTHEEMTGMVVSPSEVTSAALTPMSSGPHSNNPPTPRQQNQQNNFTRVEDLKVTDVDLDNIFEMSSSSDSSDIHNEGLFHAPNGKAGTPQHSGSSEDLHRKTTAGLMELTTMFPTPPSQEHNTAPSPCNGGPCTPSGPHSSLEEEPPASGATDCSDWTYVFRPCIVNKLVSSMIYAPVVPLPSTQLPPMQLPAECVYKATWQNRMANRDTNRPKQQQQQQQSHHIMQGREGQPQMPPGMTIAQQRRLQELQRPQVPPPHNHAMQRWNAEMGRPAPPYPLGSPGYPGSGMMSPVGGMMTPGPHHPFGASRPSSVDPYHHTSSGPPSVVREQAQPEVSSLLVNLFLSDTMLEIFRDHNFSSCTICECNMNIKGADVPMYLPCQVLSGPALIGFDESQYKCTCGFSAVVNRHLSHQAGLFYEDEVEITGIPYEAPPAKPKLTSQNENSLAAEKRLIEYIQLQCLGMTESPCSILSRVTAHALTLSDVKTSPPLSALSSKVYHKDTPLQSVQQMADYCQVTTMAVEAALVGGPAAMTQPANQWYGRTSIDEATKVSCLHKWAHLQVTSPPNNSTVVKLLRSLQPILQEGVHNQRKTNRGPSQNMWEVTYRVMGPLTWRQFHRLAGRGTEDQCEPQPIPSLLVGFDKDWLALSPFALKYWDKLLLEPYASPRDVAYVVVCPDSEAPMPHIKAFFRELSCIYESANLGRHSPINKSLKDGILKVGRSSERKLQDEPLNDDWLTDMLSQLTSEDDGKKKHLAARLRLYAQVCKYHLAPHLATQQLDKTLLDPPPQPVNKMQPPAASPRPPATPDNNPSSVGEKASTPTKQDESQDNSMGSQDQNENSPQNTMQNLQNGLNADDSLEQVSIPTIVVYLVDPFTYHNTTDGDMLRTSMMAMYRCFSQMLPSLPENIQANIQLQIVPLDSILAVEQCASPARRHDQLLQMAMSLFFHCGATLPGVPPPGQVKSLTGMGPAACQDIFIKRKMQENPSQNGTSPSSPVTNLPVEDIRTWSAPFILAPMRDKQTELGEMFGDHQERSSILYCSYCLSEDQRWLLASVSNEKGDLLRNASINIEVPNRTRRKKASARLVGLNKLMDFILNVISSNSVRPWRLIIGRLGRIGHGELKEWAQLLSRKSLLRYSRYLREVCTQCSVISSPLEVPCILSACLVSLEADSCLQVYSDQFTPDERISTNAQRCELSTPTDATCTHILVFPTSATTQSSHATFKYDGEDHMDIGDTDELFNTITQDIVGGGDDFNDIVNWNLDSPPDGVGGGGNSPSGGRSKSPNNDPMGNIMLGCVGNQINGPSGGLLGAGGPVGMNMNNQGSGKGGHGDFLLGGEEPMQLLQQPLALGYYVSTAPSGNLPKWFWAACPHLEGSNPVFLKSALLLHSPTVHQNQDDILHGNQRNGHPLDSNLTTDVLRYVLEGYNSLSWLQLNPSTHDRNSCLPVHVQNLLRLYHALHAIL